MNKGILITQTDNIHKMTTGILYAAIAVLFLIALIVVILYLRLIMKSGAIATECAVAKNGLSAAVERADKAEALCRSLQNELNAKATHIARIENENSAVNERLAMQKEQFELSMQQMRNEFKALANEALEHNTQIFNRHSEERLSAMLKPFGLDLQSFRDRVETLYGEENRQRFSLQESIKSLVEANMRISNDAVNLTNALVGTRNNKFQGDWGETILEQILENSGLIEGEQWERQATLRTEDGVSVVNNDTNRIMKPDIIVHFPGKRDIIIDSKVSLNAYMAYLSAEEEGERSVAMKEHVASVRRHIDELSAKSYDKYNIHSLDYVMLFIPNEPSYFMAMEADNGLWNYAYKKGVVLISPSNLISTLFVVNSLWTRERQQRNVQKIVDTANAIYDKFVSFTDNFTKIETALEKAHDAYREAHRQLSTGKGNITRRLQEIKKQGLLTTGKSISSSLVEDE